jgi:hypothetical protein
MKSLESMSCISWLALLALSVTGCASGGSFQAAAPRADSALVYVYRPSHYNIWSGAVPNASPHRILVNGEFMADLRNGAYYPYFARPGTNTFGSSIKYPFSPVILIANSRSELLRTNFDAGATYYLRFAVGAFGPKMTLVDPAIGAKEIQDCKLNTPEAP